MGIRELVNVSTFFYLRLYYQLYFWYMMKNLYFCHTANYSHILYLWISTSLTPRKMNFNLLFTVCTIKLGSVQTDLKWIVMIGMHFKALAYLCPVSLLLFAEPRIWLLTGTIFRELPWSKNIHGRNQVWLTIFICSDERVHLPL